MKEEERLLRRTARDSGSERVAESNTLAKRTAFFFIMRAEPGETADSPLWHHTFYISVHGRESK